LKHIITLATSVAMACGIIFLPLPGHSTEVYAAKKAVQKQKPTIVTIKQKDFTYTGEVVKGIPNGQGKLDGNLHGITFHFVGEFRDGEPYNGKGTIVGIVDGANISFSGQIKQGKPFAGTMKFKGLMDGESVTFEGNIQNGQFYEGILSGKTKDNLSIKFNGKLKNNEPYNGHLIIDGKDDTGQPLHIETNVVNGKW
jgi:hypothetical protein